MANLYSSISSYNQLAKYVERSDITCEHLLGYLKHPDASVRIDALEILGLKKEKKAISLMRSLLKDSNKDVCIQAALALIRMGDENLFNDLLASLFHADAQIVIGAALTLGKLKDRRATKALLQAFSTHDPNIGAAIAWALGQCKDVMALPWLIAAVKHDFVSANACEALGQIEHIGALEALVEALTHESEDVRAYSARALSLLKFEQDIEKKKQVVLLLRSLLQDKSRKVKLCAAVSLYRLEGDSLKT